MKNNKFFFAALFLSLALSMTWTACEKSSDLPSPGPSKDYELIEPDVPGQDTTAEVDDLDYKENDGLNEYKAGWELIPITIRMKNKVVYDVESPDKAIIFTGKGVWKEVGKLSYHEKVPFPVLKIVLDNWTGKGTITLKKVLGSPSGFKNQLTFISGFRQENNLVDGKGKGNFVAPANFVEADGTDLFSAPTKIVKSKIRITGGKGIYSGAKGKADKTEYYFSDDSSCYTYIQGSVWANTQGGEAQQGPLDVE